MARRQRRAIQNRKTEEIVNYEISRTTKTEVIEGGRVNRVSVAVVVDGIYAKNDKGELTYQPRAKEEIDRIAALVRSAIGFDQKRGDQVEVANLRLAETPGIPMSEPAGWMGMLQFTKDDIMHWIEVGVMSLLALLVLLLGVRPMLRRIMTPEGGAVAEPAACAPSSDRPARWSAPSGQAASIVPGVSGCGEHHGRQRRQHHLGGRPQYLDRRRRRSGRDLQPHLRHDRHRSGPGPGARPVGAEGRRARRQEPERNRRHHPRLAARRTPPNLEP